MKEYKLVIAEVRRSKGMKQCRLADTVGVSQSFLSEIENGEYDIKLSLLVRIANALDVHPRDLYQK